LAAEKDVSQYVLQAELHQPKGWSAQISQTGASELSFGEAKLFDSLVKGFPDTGFKWFWESVGSGGRSGKSYTREFGKFQDSASSQTAVSAPSPTLSGATKCSTDSVVGKD